jgi:hypothetical protein
VVPARTHAARGRPGPAAGRSPRPRLERSAVLEPAGPAGQRRPRRARAGGAPRAGTALGRPATAPLEVGVRGRALRVRPAPPSFVPPGAVRRTGDAGRTGPLRELGRRAPPPSATADRLRDPGDRCGGGRGWPGTEPDREDSLPDGHLSRPPPRRRPYAWDASHDGDQTQPRHFAGLGSAAPSYGAVARARVARTRSRRAVSHAIGTSPSS